MEKVPVAFVQLDSDTVYAAYDFPNCRQLAPKPTGGGMTDDEVDEAWEAHLR